MREQFLLFFLLAWGAKPEHIGFFTVMSSSSSVKSRPSSRPPGVRTLKEGPDPASLMTTILVGIILISGPLVLGAARLWFELPWLGGVALLLLLQGLRLTRPLDMGRIRQIDAIDLSVILFAVYAIIRWLTSPAEYFSRMEALAIVGYGTIFLTCRYGISRRRYGVALLYGLVALGVFEAGFGYYLYNNLDWFPFGLTERLHQYYAPRWLGTYGCPNHYGELLVMAIGASLALGSFSKLPWPVRIVCFYLAGAMMVGVMFSISRGSYLALIASVLALTIFGLRNGTVRWWVPVVAMLVLVISAGVLFSLSPDVRERYNQASQAMVSGQLSGYVRIELARDALTIARDHPIFGTGPATFVFVHPRYQSSTFIRKAVLTHDDYLNCLDDYGLVGFGIVMFFVFAITLTFFRPLWADHRWQDRTMVATGFAAWAAMLVHSTVDFNLHIPANAMLFFALVGLGLGRLQRDEAIRHWSTLSLAKLGAGLGSTVVLLSLLYGLEIGRTAVGDILYEQAYGQALAVPTGQSIQDAEQALAYDRGNVQALIFLGDLHRYQASRKEDIEDRISEGLKAMEYYQQALKGNVLDDSIHARMALTFDIMRRYSEAYFCYQDAVTHQPYNGQFWYWLGNHYWQRGMLEKAEASYLKAEQCPHGMEGSREAIDQLRALPGTQDVPTPSSGSNPLDDQVKPDADAQPPMQEAQPRVDNPPLSTEEQQQYPTANHPPTVP